MNEDDINDLIAGYEYLKKAVELVPLVTCMEIMNECHKVGPFGAIVLIEKMIQSRLTPENIAYLEKEGGAGLEILRNYQKKQN